MSFDLLRYSQNYKGHVKVKRILAVAEQTTDPILRKAAVILGLEEMKKGRNTNLYLKTLEVYQKIDPDLVIDMEWVNRTNQDATRRLDELELEYNTFRTSSLKENLRKSLIAIGEFYYSRGEFQNALKRFIRIRDHVTTPQHIAQMCLLIIKAAIELNNYAVVAQYLNRIRQVCDPNDKLLTSKIHVIGGLLDLHNSNFKAAARRFLQVDTCIVDEFDEIIRPRDIAFYGMLLSLATFDRKELKVPEGIRERGSRITLIDNPIFQNFTDWLPELKKFDVNFFDSRYALFLKQLVGLHPYMMCDVYLRLSFRTLYEKIRSKALIQYVKPFSTIDLRKMAQLFDVQLEEIELELVKLIQGGEIKAKIDSHQKLFFAKPIDLKSKTYNDVVELGDEYIGKTEKAILRMNMLKYQDFVIHPIKKTMGRKKKDENFIM